MAKKKINRRMKAKFPALKPEFNLKRRKELIDYDYIDKLSDKEKEWLNKFTEEYINASFRKNQAPLHKTKKLRKNCYDRNNASNRDILTIAKVTARAVSIDELREGVEDLVDYDLIAEIDEKKKTS
jgi:hypothetical protein